MRLLPLLLTGHLTTLAPRNQDKTNLKKFRTDFEALNLSNVQSGCCSYAHAYMQGHINFTGIKKKGADYPLSAYFFEKSAQIR